MATERVRYVNTGSTAGGNGTTNATSGANRAYASQSEAESAEQATLTAGSWITADEWLHLYCEGSTLDTAACVWAGHVTDSTRYILVESSVAGRHAGKWTSGAYTLSTTNAHALTIEVDFFSEVGAQIEVTETGGTSPRIGVFCDIAGTGAVVRIDKCIIRKNSATTNGTCHGVRVNTPLVKFICTNTLIYDFDQSAAGQARGFDLQSSGGGVVYMYNCGVHSCNRGIRDTYGAVSSGNFHVKNTWTQDCATSGGWESLGSWGSGTSYNLSEGTDAPGTSSKQSTTISFVNEAGDDFHLAVGDTGAKASGTSLASDTDWSFSDDIDGETRSGTWDIGPDQYVAAASSFPPVPSPFSPMLTILTM